jgi:putative membrane protein
MVYHAGSPVGSPQSETFKIMERRLLRGIMNPAMLVAWATGLWLAVSGGWFAARWFLAKFTLVLILSGFQGVLTGWVRAFAEDRNTRRPVVYRVANELPTLLMIGIVILVIVQPF